MQTFIFVHDQNIILDYKKVNKFSNLKNLVYVFLGDKPTDQILGFSDVIICRDLKYNLEDYPKLTSFSGWYALWKNNLITSDFINLFEYDINVSTDLQNKIESSFESEYDVIGYIPLPVSNSNYISHSPWISNLMSSLKKTYDFDLKGFIGSFESDKLISMTSNHSLKKEVFESYMEWILPMIDDVKNSSYSGHEVERSISIFYLIKNLRYLILTGELHHFQFDSHKTQKISPQKFQDNYKHLLN